jgi:predicted Rossmann fold flavoprotein
VIQSLRRAAEQAGVVLRTHTALQAAEICPDGGFILRLRGSLPAGGPAAQPLHADRLVLATGSHPSGRRLAQALGHGVVPPVPSLFSLSLAGAPLAGLAGVSLDPVALELELDLPPDASPGTASRYRQQGPLLITHRGLSGPATLRLTAFAARALQLCGYRGRLTLDWSGGRSQQELEALFTVLRQQQARRQLGTVRPWPALSRRLWLQLLQASGVDPQLRWADLGKRPLQQLITALRASRYSVSGRGPFGEEFVTAGGVPLGEVNLATMESRRVAGLHLVGELLDVDGVTGGFNFQHCWTSGWLAGQALATAEHSPT